MEDWYEKAKVLCTGGTDSQRDAVIVLLRKALAALDHARKFGRGGEPGCLHETVTRRDSGRYGCAKCDEGFMSCNDAQVFAMKEISALTVELDDLRKQIRERGA